MDPDRSIRRADERRKGLVWWAWSALFAAVFGGLEALTLVFVAVTGDVEFGVLALYFVAIATIVAMPATGLLIFAWLLLVRGLPMLDRSRGWLVPFTLLFGWPLIFAPISLYELAVAAPTLLGFILPRFTVRELRAGLFQHT